MGLAFGHLNADAYPDFVTVESQSALSVLHGSSTGMLSQAPALTSTANQCSGVILVDLNNNGLLDSVVATSKMQNRVVDVRYGLGDAGFSTPTAFPTAGGADMVTSADFNDDGWADLALPTNENGVGTLISVLINDRDGGFNLSSTSVRNYPATVATGDFDGDSRVDMAVGLVCGPACGIDFVHGNGDGTFAVGVPKLTNVNAGTVVAGDLNGDGRADLATVTNNSITVLLSRDNCPIF